LCYRETTQTGCPWSWPRVSLSIYLSIYLTYHYSPATTHLLQAHSGLFSEAQSGAGFQRPLLVIMERSADLGVMMQACAWRVHGVCMACAWRVHGVCMAWHGMCMACAWHAHAHAMRMPHGMCMVSETSA